MEEINNQEQTRSKMFIIPELPAPFNKEYLPSREEQQKLIAELNEQRKDLIEKDFKFQNPNTSRTKAIGIQNIIQFFLQEFDNLHYDERALFSLFVKQYGTEIKRAPRRAEKRRP